MAFSTQKDFLKIGFLNQNVNPADKKRSDAVLKNYESCTDSRAWALDEEPRSNYLVDIVKRLPHMSVASSTDTVEPNVARGDGENIQPATLVVSQLELRKMTKEALIKLVLRLYEARAQQKASAKDTTKLTKSLESTIAELENKIRLLLLQQDESHSLVIALDGQASDLRASLTQQQNVVTKSLESRITELENKIRDLSEENRQLKHQQAESDSFDIALDSRTSELWANLTQERNELRAQVDRMLEIEPVLVGLQERASYVDELSCEKQKLTELIDELNMKISQNAIEIANLEAENSFIKAKVGDYDKCLAELALFKANYKSCQNSNQELKVKVLEAECCEKELHTYKLKLCRACKEIDTCEKEIEKLIKMIEQQQYDNQVLDDKLSRANDKLRQMTNLEADVANLKEQLQMAIEESILEETSFVGSYENHKIIEDSSEIEETPDQMMSHVPCITEPQLGNSTRSRRITEESLKIVTTTLSKLGFSDPNHVNIVGDDAFATTTITDLQILSEENAKLKTVLNQCRARLSNQEDNQNFSDPADPSEIVQHIVDSEIKKSILAGENEALKSNSISLENNFANMQFQSEWMKRDFEELKKTNQELHAQIETCSGTVQQQQQTIEELKQKLVETIEASDQISELQRKQSSDEIISITKSVENLENELFVCTDELAKSCQDLEYEMQMVTELREKLEYTMAELERAEECCQLKTNEAELNFQELQKAKETCGIKTAELNLLHTENMALKAEVKKMREEINEADVMIEKLQQQRASNRRLTETLGALTQEIQSSVQLLSSGKNKDSAPSDESSSSEEIELDSYINNLPQLETTHNNVEQLVAEQDRTSIADTQDVSKSKTEKLSTEKPESSPVASGESIEKALKDNLSSSKSSVNKKNLDSKKGQLLASDHQKDENAVGTKVETNMPEPNTSIHLATKAFSVASNLSKESNQAETQSADGIKTLPSVVSDVDSHTDQIKESSLQISNESSTTNILAVTQSGVVSRSENHTDQKQEDGGQTSKESPTSSIPAETQSPVVTKEMKPNNKNIEQTTNSHSQLSEIQNQQTVQENVPSENVINDIISQHPDAQSDVLTQEIIVEKPTKSVNKLPEKTSTPLQQTSEGNIPPQKSFKADSNKSLENSESDIKILATPQQPEGQSAVPKQESKADQKQVTEKPFINSVENLSQPVVKSHVPREEITDETGTNLSSTIKPLASHSEQDVQPAITIQASTKNIGLEKSSNADQTLKTSKQQETESKRSSSLEKPGQEDLPVKEKESALENASPPKPLPVRHESEIQELIDSIDETISSSVAPIKTSGELPSTTDVGNKEVARVLEQLKQETKKTVELEKEIRLLEDRLTESELEKNAKIDGLKGELSQCQKNSKKLADTVFFLQSEIGRKNELIKDLEQQIENLNNKITSTAATASLPLQNALIRKSFEIELNKSRTMPADKLTAITLPEDHDQQISQLAEIIKTLEEENRNLKKTLEELIYGKEKDSMNPVQKVCLKLRDSGKEALSPDDLVCLHKGISVAANKQKHNIIEKFFPTSKLREVEILNKQLDSSKKVVKDMQTMFAKDENVPTRIPASKSQRSILKRSSNSKIDFSKHVRATKSNDTSLNRKQTRYETMLLASPYYQHPEYTFGKSHGNHLHVRKKAF